MITHQESRVARGSANYPKELPRFLAADSPQVLHALGNVSRLNSTETIGLFCSVKCPGGLILRTYDLARALRDEGRLVVSGFHSPMERECLALLLKGKQPVIVCLARSLTGFRVPSEWRQALDDGRLLILSAFESAPRATTELAIQRNLLVAAMADEIFIAHSEQGSKTEAFAAKVASWGKPLLTFEGRDNEVLFGLGATPVRVDPR